MRNSNYADISGHDPGKKKIRIRPRKTMFVVQTLLVILQPRCGSLFSKHREVVRCSQD